MPSKGGESTPLLGGGSHNRTNSNSNYYFLAHPQGGDESSVGAGSRSSSKKNKTVVHEEMPSGAQPDAFEPKLLENTAKVRVKERRYEKLHPLFP